ncbi:hypothetical protein GCM10007973_22930 [Polymorphobacter multimanifer]|uniref:Uncharacterized protein (DUF433 family) n=1 Tax=Polymorphobacter multimanifer TaxID=1070431 RepID=A0A841L9D4_9SPHN|nr:DUF433 domain-containing protein [Polymorphobacter multimanifer]MBB6228231.1 uncharacterized protein (DUF433 family) [Polymorphobacter multimanifer]GGI85768.1 hypothetical protein GCM10007973_22930 [Polymorphobacter multimanifer]
MDSYLDHIESRPGVLGGKPCVKGTRMRVRDVLAYLAGGDSVDDLVAAFPYLSRADVLACLAFAADQADHPVLIAAE